MRGDVFRMRYPDFHTALLTGDHPPAVQTQPLQSLIISNWLIIDKHEFDGKRLP